MGPQTGVAREGGRAFGPAPFSLGCWLSMRLLVSGSAFSGRGRSSEEGGAGPSARPPFLWVAGSVCVFWFLAQCVEVASSAYSGRCLSSAERALAQHRGLFTGPKAVGREDG